MKDSDDEGEHKQVDESNSPYTSISLTDDGELVRMPARKRKRKDYPRNRIIRYVLVLVAVLLSISIGLLVIKSRIPTDSSTTGISLQASCSDLLSNSKPAISFVSTSVNAGGGLYLTDLQGSAYCRIPHDTGIASYAWSANASQVVIACTNRVCLMNSNGDNKSYVDASELGQGVDDIDWSRDGLHFVFSANPERVSSQRVSGPPCPDCGTSGIYIMDVDGSHMHALSAIGTDSASEPRWSPDSQQITFVSDATGHSEIYIMQADGSNVQQVTHLNAETASPDWSPDGKSIVFVAYQNGNYDIYSIEIDGSNLRQLTNNPARDHHPAWSADGKYIAFSSLRNGTNAIFVMNSDGSDQHRVTDSTFIADDPHWVPSQVQ
jgi:WD40-like Beta Propeller Repeat